MSRHEYGTDPETGKRIRIMRNAPTPKSFWSYQAPDAPSLETAIAAGRIAASTTIAQWESLSPGMRREICRNIRQRESAMSAWENVWSFETANLRVAYDVAPEDDLDLSWDDDGSTREGLESGKYVAFVARVRVSHKATGAELGVDYLRSCIYESAEAFISHRDPDPMHRNCSIMRAARGANVCIGHYFPDMVSSAIHEARKQLATLRTMKLRAA